MTSLGRYVFPSLKNSRWDADLSREAWFSVGLAVSLGTMSVNVAGIEVSKSSKGLLILDQIDSSTELARSENVRENALALPTARHHGHNSAFDPG